MGDHKLPEPNKIKERIKPDMSSEILEKLPTIGYKTFNNDLRLEHVLKKVEKMFYITLKLLI